MLLAESFSLDNIGSRELSVAAVGLLIVFTSLVLISGFIAILPKILESLNKLLPETEHHHGATAPAAASAAAPDEAVVVAIGAALHAKMQSKSTE